MLLWSTRTKQWHGVWMIKNKFYSWKNEQSRCSVTCVPYVNPSEYTRHTFVNMLDSQMRNLYIFHRATVMIYVIEEICKLSEVCMYSENIRCWIYQAGKSTSFRSHSSYYWSTWQYIWLATIDKQFFEHNQYSFSIPRLMSARMTVSLSRWFTLRAY